MSTDARKDLAGDDFDKAGQDDIEGRSTTGEAPDGEAETPPTPGTHAEADFTNRDATPGSGALPSAKPQDEADAATG